MGGPNLPSAGALTAQHSPDPDGLAPKRVCQGAPEVVSDAQES